MGEERNQSVLGKTAFYDFVNVEIKGSSQSHVSREWSVQVSVRARPVPDQCSLPCLLTELGMNTAVPGLLSLRSLEARGSFLHLVTQWQGFFNKLCLKLPLMPMTMSQYLPWRGVFPSEPVV